MSKKTFAWKLENNESGKFVLVIIDPQNCFMDYVNSPLRVVGANADMDRLVQFIIQYGELIDHIIVTIDTHPADHIGHAVRWIDEETGECPAAFSLVPQALFDNGRFRAAEPRDQHWQREYLYRLEATGRMHTIWPVHGQKGTWEHEVYQPLQQVLNQWEGISGKAVRYVEKGMHRDTEQFGVFAANVPIADAPETMPNRSLINEIRSYELQGLCGQASSHCVKDSGDQFCRYVHESEFFKLTVFRDLMSPVAAVTDNEGNVVVDFPAQAEAWFKSLEARGVNVELVAPMLKTA